MAPPAVPLVPVLLVPLLPLVPLVPLLPLVPLFPLVPPVLLLPADPAPLSVVPPPPLVPEVDDAVFFRFVVFALFMLLLGGVPLTWAPVAACACAAPEPVGVPVAGVCARAAAQPAAATMPTKV